jgi:hypothetical protein
MYCVTRRLSKRGVAGELSNVLRVNFGITIEGEMPCHSEYLLRALLLPAGAVVVSSGYQSRAASKAGEQQAAAASKPQAFNLKLLLKLHEIQADAATRAAEIQAQSAREAGAIQERIAQEQIAQARRTFGEQREFLQPFQSAGLNALSRIQAGISPGGEFIRPFTMDQFQADPGYAFRLSEGQKRLSVRLRPVVV